VYCGAVFEIITLSRLVQQCTLQEHVAKRSERLSVTFVSRNLFSNPSVSVES
jgi:hypothetical protein